MKYFYIVFDAKENDKRYSYVERISECENLVGYMIDEHIVSANIAHSKKEAEKWVDSLNKGYKQRGIYKFDLV